MVRVDISELSKIPYLDLEHLQGRIITTTSFFVDGEWNFWLPTAQGLIRTQCSPREADYFGNTAEKSADTYLAFLDFIAQRCSWPDVIRPLRGLQQDFLNICASIKKFNILFEQSARLRTATSRLVVTELEYIFTICRSVFDLLQEIIAVQWQSFCLVDTTITKKQLKKKFSDMVISSGRLRSEDDLVNCFHIPRPLAAFYVRSGPFFEVLRTFRDRFVHGGTTPELVFVTERGFAVPRNTDPFCSFNVWTQEHMLPNNLCSLRPVIGHIVIETLRVCEDYAATIQSIIEFPPPIAPNMHLFIRGHFNDSLSECLDAVERCLWWSDC